MELGLASLSSIFGIVKSFNCDAKFSIDFGFSVSCDLLFSNLASHFHNSIFEMFLVVRFYWIAPVIAPVAVNFTNDLDYEWVGVGVRGGMIWSWRRW